MEPIFDTIAGCGPLCFSDRRWHEGFTLPMAGLNDAEGPRLSASLPEVIDSHVHLFPDRMFEAIWAWFDTYGWPIRYKLKAPDVIPFLLGRGVSRIVALHYAHKEGIARRLNQFMAELVKSEPRVTGVAAVMPGEPGAAEILEEAWNTGLRGVKLHCHVQAFAPDDPKLHDIYEVCQRRNQPLVMHAGREPSSPAYPVDPYTLCSTDRTEAVLRSFPRLRLCIPHLGADEFEGYERLLERYDNLYLDTTMAAARYFPVDTPWRLIQMRPDRISYGTDFPHLPYAWDREVNNLASGLKDEALAQVLSGTARDLFGI